MDSILAPLQEIVVICAGAAVTALCGYAFTWLRAFLGIKESDANEGEIRRAAQTEAGKLVVQGKLEDPEALLAAVAKIVSDLNPAVKEENYNSVDIKDMIIGAAATIFPPANLLKLLK